MTGDTSTAKNCGGATHQRRNRRKEIGRNWSSVVLRSAGGCLGWRKGWLAMLGVRFIGARVESGRRQSNGGGFGFGRRSVRAAAMKDRGIDEPE